MTTSTVEYDFEGTTHIGYLATPDSDPEGPVPGILVLHEGPGLGGHATDIADRLAGLGYVAFALDYNGGGRLLDYDAMMARLATLSDDPELTRRLAAAGLDILRNHALVNAEQIAAVGYCFGGTMALELARTGADLRAVVGIHSGLATARAEESARITGRVLVCVGADDPLISADERAQFIAEMSQTGVDWQVQIHGGAGHSFSNPEADTFNIPGVGYHEDADRRSWESMLALFSEALADAPVSATTAAAR